MPKYQQPRYGEELQKMRKITKRGMVRKLDKIVSEIVRARGSCAKCRKGAETVTLQCAHIFSRRNMSVRFDLLNCLPLCYACHFYWAHKEPIEFTEFVKEYLGKYYYEQLRIRAKTILKWTMEDMQTLYTKLQELRDGTRRSL